MNMPSQGKLPKDVCIVKYFPAPSLACLQEALSFRVVKTHARLGVPCCGKGLTFTPVQGGEIGKRSQPRLSHWFDEHRHPCSSVDVAARARSVDEID
jgi:hypothetical protein